MAFALHWPPLNHPQLLPAQLASVQTLWRQLLAQDWSVTLPYPAEFMAAWEQSAYRQQLTEAWDRAQTARRSFERHWRTMQLPLATARARFEVLFSSETFCAVFLPLYLAHHNEYIRQLQTQLQTDTLPIEWLQMAGIVALVRAVRATLLWVIQHQPSRPLPLRRKRSASPPIALVAPRGASALGAVSAPLLL